MIKVRLATVADAGVLKMSSPLPKSVILHKIVVGEVIVAEMSGTTVGFCFIEFLWSKFPYIGMVRVDEHHRRRGFGRAMLQFLEARLRDQGHRKLYSSSQANEPEPQSWHRQMGFDECGFIAGINEDGIGEIFFQKQL